MATLRTILAPDGRVAVDIELPHGQQCVEVDAELRAILAVLGSPLGIITNDPTARPRQPEAVAATTPTKVGGGSQ